MKSKFFGNSSFMVVHNVAFASYYGPERALIDFFRREKVAKLLYVQHPVPPFFKDLSSRSDLYAAGERVNSRFAPCFRIADMRILTIYNALATFFFVLLIKNRFSVFVGSDGRNALVGIILRRLGFVKTVIYLTHSYSGGSSYSVTVALERCLDRYCSTSADFVWNLSKKLTKIRETQGVVKERNVWVPVGIKHEDIKKPVNFPRSSDIKKIVFVGVLSDGKGVELILQALPIILKRLPKVQLLIVGGGPLEDELKLTCRQLGIEGNVIFKGYLEYQKLMEFLPLCHLGLAPYEPISENTAFTTDPLKPKLYMACGLPVIITDFPETAAEIRNCEAGLVIHYDALELANAAIKLLTDADLFEKCSSNAVKVASKYEWNETFSGALLRAFRTMSK